MINLDIATGKALDAFGAKTIPPIARIRYGRFMEDDDAFRRRLIHARDRAKIDAEVDRILEPPKKLLERQIPSIHDQLQERVAQAASKFRSPVISQGFRNGSYYFDIREGAPNELESGMSEQEARDVLVPQLATGAKESMTQRALRRMMTPRPNPLQQAYEEALECVAIQMKTIEKQREHIAALDARIAKLEAEADGLTSLI